ncbi:trichohyalin-like [Cotesia glomerata]|uniref:trichohyalin-like n=1 Tax=Cotesia glomerata TaxID=32391 RepID=UPI001D003436|nr:trichohyalin-like [Cotesia glomerata]
MLITLSRKSSDKGQALQKTIEGILQEEAKVICKGPQEDVEIRDLDDTTTREDIQAALHMATGESCEVSLEAIKIRKAYRGTQTASSQGVPPCASEYNSLVLNLQSSQGVLSGIPNTSSQHTVSFALTGKAKLPVAIKDFQNRIGPVARTLRFNKPNYDMGDNTPKPRISWIYNLTKARLTEELVARNVPVDAGSSREDLRRLLRMTLLNDGAVESREHSRHESSDSSRANSPVRIVNQTLNQNTPVQSTSNDQTFIVPGSRRTKQSAERVKERAAAIAKAVEDARIQRLVEEEVQRCLNEQRLQREAEQTRLNEERRREAEQMRRDEERQREAEQTRLNEERRREAERVRLNEERQRKAEREREAERVRLNEERQQEADQERQREAERERETEQARLDEETEQRRPNEEIQNEADQMRLNEERQREREQRRLRDERRHLEEEVRRCRQAEQDLLNEQRRIRELRAELDRLQQNQSNNSTTVRTSQEVNIKDQVRKWNVQFDGEKDLLTFLERVEELSDSYQVTKDQLLECIPVLLKDNALLWYRNNKANWRTWNEFADQLKKFYLPTDIHTRWEEEIKHRTQGEKESARDYITVLQTMMRRYGKMSEYNQIDRLYFNLRPEYQRYIRRSEIHSVANLLSLASDYERIAILEKNYKPPPPQPQYSLLPPKVYKEKEKEKEKDKKKKEEVTSINQPYVPEEVCWRCGERGHIRPNCTNPWKKFCSRCGKEGVYSRDCTCPKSGNFKGVGKGTAPSNRPPQEQTSSQETSRQNQRSQNNNGIQQTYYQKEDGRIYTDVYINQYAVPALIDTGATRSCISEESWNQIKNMGIKLDSQNQDQVATQADGSRLPIIGHVKVRVRILGELKRMSFQRHANNSQTDDYRNRHTQGLEG